MMAARRVDVLPSVAAALLAAGLFLLIACLVSSGICA